VAITTRRWTPTSAFMTDSHKMKNVRCPLTLLPKIMRVSPSLLGLRYIVRICTDLGLKDLPEYSAKLSKVERSKSGGSASKQDNERAAIIHTEENKSSDVAPTSSMRGKHMYAFQSVFTASLKYVALDWKVPATAVSVVSRY
jgi:hypothetical protein